MRFFTACLSFLLAAIAFAPPAAASELLTPEERAWVAEHPRVRVGGSAAYGPFTFIDAEGRQRGLSVDYAERLQKLTGLQFEFQPPQPFADNLAALGNGNLDLMMALRATPERARQFGFTRPFITVPAVLLRRSGGSSDELQPGETVAVSRGYAVADFLHERFPGNPLQIETDDKTLLRRLAGGETSAAVADLAGATFLMRTEGIGNVRVLGDVGFSYDLAVGYRRDWPLLGRVLDKALARISADERQALADRWIGPERESERWQRQLLWVAGVALTVVLLGLGLMLLWNRSLQRQVVARTEQLRLELAERRRLQDADHARAMAELANKAKSEFMSQASHELRTPLNAVLGFSQLLSSDPKRPLDEAQRHRVHHIENAAEHLLVLIDDMMSFSRIEGGSLTVNPVPTQAGPLLRRCVELARPAAVAAGVQLELDDVDTLPEVQADPIRLEQVLHNLLSNAIKYNRSGGWVRVRAWRQSAQPFCIEVADSGLGLNAEQLSQLFQPFNRLGRSEQEGTGIGLVICKQLMDRMGGHISVASEAGQGSRFTLELQAA